MLLMWAASQQRSGGSGPSFDPLSLFANGEQGFWLDPSDFDTMFQDVDGEVPVTEVGQSVALILDKSGNEHSFVQATEANRPVLRADGDNNYLEFDGTVSGLASSATIDFTGTNAVTVCAGVRKASDAARGMLLELANNAARQFQLNAPRNAAADYSFISRGSAGAVDAVATPFAAGTSHVVTGLGDIVNDICIIRVNGSQITSVTTDQGAGPYMNSTVYVGRRGGTTFPFNGRLYQMIVRGALTGGDDLAGVESYVNGKTGAY